jgi:dihydrofolate reductase
MRKLVLSMGVSLDGLVARPGRMGAAGWGIPPDDPALKERKLGGMKDIDLHLMGRNTYEEMAEFWPVSDDAYAAPMNEIQRWCSPARSSVPSGRSRGSQAAT